MRWGTHRGAAVWHNHGPVRPLTSGATLDQLRVGSPPAGICFLCLAAHVPAPAPVGQAVFSAPRFVTKALSIKESVTLGSNASRSTSPRAPPSFRSHPVQVSS